MGKLRKLDVLQQPQHTTMMTNQLSDRLRRLGVKKGARQLRPAPPLDPDNETFKRRTSTGEFGRASMSELPAGDGEPIEALFPEGQEIESSAGRCFMVEHRYALDTPHGRWRLGDMLTFGVEPLPLMFDPAHLIEGELHESLFLDTETTGLYGAGVFPFLVGAGLFEEDQFVVRQFFARDHDEETAVLHAALELIEQRKNIVSFNGHAFDLPLLDARFRMNQLQPAAGTLMDQPGMDLFKVGRRLWRWSCPSCSLMGLEQSVMSIVRHEPDIPGSQIPWVYRQFIQQQDARPLTPVFSHNRFDLLSMVTLLAELLLRFSEEQGPYKPLEHYGMARYWLSQGAADRAESQLRLAASFSATDVLDGGQRLILRELAKLLKRQKRYQEARSCWEMLATTGRDVDACVELAKWYEWGEKDLTAALVWTENSLNLPGNIHIRDELTHRRDRLSRKLSQNR